MFSVFIPEADKGSLIIMDPGPSLLDLVDWQIAACALLVMLIFWYVTTHKKEG